MTFRFRQTFAIFLVVRAAAISLAGCPDIIRAADL